MAQKSREYWRRRFELLEESQHNRSLFYYDDLIKAYTQTMSEIEADILKWYNRFASNNEITLDEAKGLLKSDELREFHWTVDEYIEYGKKNALNQQWMKQLENASSRVHISRLESIRIQLQQHVEKLYDGQIKGFERFVQEAYQTQYYHTAFEVQKALGIGYAIQKIDERMLEKVISNPWTADGLTFSRKIWRDKNVLLDTLHKELIQSVARGTGPEKIISTLHKKLGSQNTRYQIKRLVMTESAFFSASAQKDAFNELEVEQYEIIATLDGKTSDICQSMDGKVFKMTDFEPGVTANPFHPFCRTTTAPYFDDDYSQRIARDCSGQIYYVPSNMKYEEWYENQVGIHGKKKIESQQKMQANKILDKNQYEKYKIIFGNDLGVNSLNDFQKLKYNDINKWNELKQQKQSVLNTLDYRDSFFGLFGDKEVRIWYKTHDKSIPEKLNPKDSLETQARKSHTLRNQYRTEARLMMSDRDSAEHLNKTRANLTFEDLINRKKEKYQLEGEAAYKDIIRSSQTTNKMVDKSLGLEES